MDKKNPWLIETQSKYHSQGFPQLSIPSETNWWANISINGRKIQSIKNISTYHQQYSATSRILRHATIPQLPLIFIIYYKWTNHQPLRMHFPYKYISYRSISNWFPYKLLASHSFPGWLLGSCQRLYKIIFPRHHICLSLCPHNPESHHSWVGIDPSERIIDSWINQPY